MKKDYKEWIQTFRDSIAGWESFINFDRVYNETRKLKMELNLLNSLVGSKNIEKDFRDLVQRYPEVLKVIPILTASRQNEINITEARFSQKYIFSAYGNDIEEYILFMYKTGLFDLISNHIMSSIVDYVQGVLVGLDINNRLNKDGYNMTSLVEYFVMGVCDKFGYKYERESSIMNIDNEKVINYWLDSRKPTNKRFDFIVNTPNFTYVIETIFTSRSGSKLNEQLRNIIEMNEKFQNTRLKFVFIIDGKAGIQSNNYLEEIYENIEHVYNIYDLEKNILMEIIR